MFQLLLQYRKFRSLAEEDKEKEKKEKKKGKGEYFAYNSTAAVCSAH